MDPKSVNKSKTIIIIIIIAVALILVCCISSLTTGVLWFNSGDSATAPSTRDSPQALSVMPPSINGQINVNGRWVTDYVNGENNYVSIDDYDSNSIILTTNIISTSSTISTIEKTKTYNLKLISRKPFKAEYILEDPPIITGMIPGTGSRIFKVTFTSSDGKSGKFSIIDDITATVLSNGTESPYRVTLSVKVDIIKE